MVCMSSFHQVFLQLLLTLQKTSTKEKRGNMALDVAMLL